MRAVLKEAKPRGFSVTEHGGGNGNWLVYRKTAIVVVIEADDESFEMNVTNRVKDIYSRSKITKRLVETFRSDIATGKINIEDL